MQKIKLIVTVCTLLAVFAGYAAAAERFVDNEDGTVTDTRTNLMWAAKDNGGPVTWQDAKSYCENFSIGGYTDWRMPTQDELAGLYDETRMNRHGYHTTSLIEITGCCPWASETRGSAAARFDFTNGSRRWPHQSSGATHSRALPVRSGI